MADRKRRGGATEEQRELERTALLSLAVHSYPEREQLRATITRLSNGELLDPEQALQVLAEVTEKRTRAAPRLMVLNTLIRLSEREGRALFAEEGAGMSRLLEALVQEAKPDTDVAPSAAAEHLRQQFLLAVDADADVEVREQLLPELTATLALTDAEQWGPRCDDRTGIEIRPGVYATEVAVEFWTDRTVAEMAPWADPRNWPHCSLYFEAMNPLNQPTVVAGPPPGWIGQFMEVVTGFPGKKLETPLEFSYTENLSENDVICSYDLVAATADIDFDRGNLWARVDGSGPPHRPTHVSSTKLIHFTDPDMQAGSSLACDTFWTELAITMALTCSNTGAPGETAYPPTTNQITTPPVAGEGDAPVPDDKDKKQDAKQTETMSDLDLLFKKALTQATASVERYTELATNAAKRIAAGDVDAGAWSKDIAAVTANYVKDVGSAFDTWSEAMKIISGDAAAKKTDT